MVMLYSVKALALLIIILPSTIQAAPILLPPSEESLSSGHDIIIPHLFDSLGPVIPSTNVFEDEDQTRSKDESPSPSTSMRFREHDVIYPHVESKQPRHDHPSEKTADPECSGLKDPYCNHKKDEQKEEDKPKRIPEEPRRQDSAEGKHDKAVYKAKHDINEPRPTERPGIDRVQELIDYHIAINEPRYDRGEQFVSRPILQHGHEAQEQEATDDKKTTGERWQYVD